MSNHSRVYKSVILAAIMVLSVVAGTMTVAGTSDAIQTDDPEAVMDGGGPTQVDANVQTDSAKPLTISWFRDDGDANGPYPVPPNEYEGEDSPGITMFTNAEGDAQLRVDGSIARNPNGQWDMLTLHVETDGLDELNPPMEGADKGLVTQQFLENDNWNVEIKQTNGEKILNVADNQDGYENPAGTSADIPPVMVFADTEEIDSDFTVGDEPDTGLFVWVDPNRAVLTENGEETSFEPGDEFEATFQIGEQTSSTSFEMVEGTVEMGGDLTPSNTAKSTISGRTTLAAGSEVEVVLDAGDVTRSSTVEVKGNEVLMDSDSAASAPRGYVNATLDLTGLAGQDFDVDVYAPGPAGGMIDGEPVRDDDESLAEENRIHIANGSGTVQNVIDPDYTIGSAEIYDSKALTIAYTNPDHESPAGLGNQIGDGHATGDFSLAKNVDGHGKFDEMWLLYESTDISEAIEMSPGSNQVEKFLNSPLSVEIAQSNADGTPKRVNLSRNASGVHIFTDNGDSDERAYNETEMVGLVFSLLPNEMQFYQDGKPVTPEVGDEFEATLTIDTENGTVTETVTFDIVAGQTVLAEPPLELTQSQSATVQFNTTQTSGTGMAIHFEAVAENGSVIMEETTGEMKVLGMGPVIAGKHATTNPWGSIAATFDTTALPAGTEIVAEARIVADVPDEDLPANQSYVTVEKVTGTIVAPPSAALSLSDQSGDGETVVVDEVNISDGGFVSLHLGSPTGETIGASEYLESGTETDLAIELDTPINEESTVYAVAHEDTNDNEAFDFPNADEPYMSDGSATTASAEYALASQTTEQTTEATTDQTTEATTEQAPDETTEPTEETTTTSGPGFTLVAALLAVLSVAAIGVRHR